MIAVKDLGTAGSITAEIGILQEQKECTTAIIIAQVVFSYTVQMLCSATATVSWAPQPLRSG